jgi:hypothetical protein
VGIAGLSKSRLERMHQVLSGYVERKEMPGLVALVSHHDDIHVETLGAMSFGHPAPMKRDTILALWTTSSPQWRTAEWHAVTLAKFYGVSLHGYG